MRVFVVAAFYAAAVLAPVRLCAQEDLPSRAAAAATAWRSHDFVTLVGGGRVEIRLPGVSASGPVPAEQAVVLLRGHVRGATEVSVEVTSAVAVSEVSGFAELRRRFRTGRVGEEGEETILLGFVRGGPGGAGWRLEVVQVVGSRGR
jgi:hypothetical protein